HRPPTPPRSPYTTLFRSDLDRVKRDIAASGYKGEKIVVLGPTDIERLNAMSQVTTDVYRRLGLNVDYVATDWGTVIQRLSSREPDRKSTCLNSSHLVISY